MRGSVAKKLRKYVKEDMKGQPWVEYNQIRRSFHSPNTMTVLDVGCQRWFYQKRLKKIWKAF